MIEISITPSDDRIGNLISSLEQTSAKKLSNTIKAFSASLGFLQYTWKSYANGSAIPGTAFRIKHASGLYVKSIIKERTNFVSGRVVSNSPYASAIENGSDAKDLKKIIPYGPKARKGKNGPYTIIPFRHGVPSSQSNPMPDAVYAKIRDAIRDNDFKKSRQIGTYPGLNANGKVVTRYKYAWGSRLKGMKAQGFPNLEGLVAFNTSAGAGKSSGYVTFRIISANKPTQKKAQAVWANKWLVPAKQGMHLTQHVVKNSANKISELMVAGMKADLLADGMV